MASKNIEKNQSASKKITLDENFTITVQEKESEPFNTMKDFLNSKLALQESSLKALKDYVDKNLNSEEKEENTFSLESDTYILMSLVLSLCISLILYLCVMSFFFACLFIVMILYPITYWCSYFKDCNSFFRDMYCSCFFFQFLLLFLTLFWILAVLIFPAILVVLTQIFCVISIFPSMEEISDSSKIDNLVVKWALNMFLLFMVCNEAVQSVKSIFFIMIKIMIFISNCFFDLNILGLFLGFVPPLAQMIMSFIIYYLSISMIYVEQDMVNFIQSFAGFYVILELDNLTMKFLQTIDFYGILKWISIKFAGYNEKEDYTELKQKTLSNILMHQDPSVTLFKDVFKKVILNDDLKDLLTKENIVLKGEEAMQLKKYENWLLLAKSVVIIVGLTIVYLEFNDLLNLSFLDNFVSF